MTRELDLQCRCGEGRVVPPLDRPRLLLLGLLLETDVSRNLSGSSCSWWDTHSLPHANMG